MSASNIGHTLIALLVSAYAIVYRGFDRLRTPRPIWQPSLFAAVAQSLRGHLPRSTRSHVLRDHTNAVTEG
jgi:hypothetical protein